MKLIDKDVLVAEIKRFIKLLTKEKNQEGASQIDKLSLGARIAMLEEILSFLDTLETKEVDLEKELDKYTTDNFCALEENSENPYLVEKDDMLKIVKYFYELGLNTQKGD